MAKKKEEQKSPEEQAPETSSRENCLLLVKKCEEFLKGNAPGKIPPHLAILRRELEKL